MFDISWSEFLLIGVVALIVIGPKELPAVMRTLGQWTRKVRGMATEFQNQFHEAMREAEMADFKKEVDTLAQDVRSFDPTRDVRDDLRGLGEDVKQSLTASGPEAASAVPAADPQPAQTQPALTQASAGTLAAPLELTSTPAADAAPLPKASAPQASRDLETVAAQGEPAAKEAADKPADATGHRG